MDSEKNDNLFACPHCGAENLLAAKDWMNVAGDNEPIICSHCKKPLNNNNPAISPEQNQNTRNQPHKIVFWVVAIFLLGVMFYLNRTFEVFTSKEGSAQIIYEILIVLLISAAIAFGRISQNLKYLAIWGGIFLIFMIGYSYRSDLSHMKEKVLAELIPERGFQKNLNSASFPVSSDGHFYIRVHVNGIPIRFLVDTGASNIVLSPEDAEKLGFDLKRLVFDRFYETANGKIRGSSVRISNFEIGNFHLKEIGASINEAEMRESLLGMTFFKHLESYEVKDNMLTLYWKP